MERLRSPISLALALALAAAGLFFAWRVAHHAFLQDDAYIFLRYAAHVVDGEGPVWNAGERVEGYTSPAWLALVAGALAAAGPAHVHVALHALTVGLALVTLALSFALARRAAGPLAGALALALLCSDRSFAVWSTSGMETRLYGALALAVTAAALHGRERQPTLGQGIGLGALMLALSLARPEGLLLSALGGLVALAGGVDRGRVRALSAAAAVWLGGVGLHLAWRLAYYGRPLPNTFYAKVSGTDFAGGLRYLGDFAASYPFLTVAVLAAAVLALARERGLGPRRACVGVIAALTVYLASVGGDFMEFRMLDVLLPYAAVLVAVTVVELGRAAPSGTARTAVIVVALALPVAHAVDGLRFLAREHVGMDWEWMGERTTRRWAVVGRWLARVAEPGESVATTAAGAIPYFSGLPALDMLGLSDAHVASLPADPSRPVGHRRLAPPEYLRERGVTFVLGQPALSPTPIARRLSPDELVVRVENDDAGVWAGRDFWLLLRTTRERDALAADLRRRGVSVRTK